MSKGEAYVECTHDTTFTCELSKRPELNAFMAEVFLKFTRLLYVTLDICFGHHPKLVIPNLDVRAQMITESITRFYLEDADAELMQRGKRYVIKPGFNKASAKEITTLRRIVESATSEPVSTNVALVTQTFSLSQIMGAVYGAVVNQGVFHLIFWACSKHKAAFDAALGVPNYGKFLRRKLKANLATFKDIFALPASFTLDDFWELGVFKEDCVLPLQMARTSNGGACMRIIRGGSYNVLLDMMVYQSGPAMSIVNRNLNNQEYVRKRNPKAAAGVSVAYRQSAQTPASCPSHMSFADGQPSTAFLVHGDNWYQVEQESVYAALLKKYKRVVKAGPSGSTFMWANFVFDLLGYERSGAHMRQLLLCIIADFVPYFHSLNEVLFVFSRLKGFEGEVYTIDQDPAVWLERHVA